MDIITLADKQIYKLAQLNDKVTENKLLQVLKQYNLIDALNIIGETYRYMLHNSKTDDLRITNFEIKDSIYRLRADALIKLIHYLIKSGANNYRHQYLSFNAIPNLLALCHIITNIYSIPINKETLLNQLIILYTEQIEFQNNVKIKLCRNYILLKKYEDEFKELTGLTLKEYFNSTLLLILFLNNNQTTFTINDLFNIFPDEKSLCFSKINMQKVLHHLSIDSETYKIKIPEYETKNLTPLIDKPILIMNISGKKKYCAPSPQAIIEKVYNNTFFDIEKVFNANIDFRNDFGYKFEKYVGDIINSYNTSLKIIPEAELDYKKNNSTAKFVDWTVIDNDDVYLIEVKAISMPLKDIYSITTHDFIKKHIIKAYMQIMQKIIDIDNIENFCFLRNKHIIPIIVFRHIPFINIDLFTKEINEVINTVEEYKDVASFLSKHKILLFDIDDFEFYWANRKNVPIENLFQNIPNEHSLRSYIESSCDSIEEHKIFDKIYDEIFDDYEIKNNIT